tara:strand:+ start:198 stop:689 length:492 start_codon:yes stop_codon:yes gene_type:complete
MDIREIKDKGLRELALKRREEMDESYARVPKSYYLGSSFDWELTPEGKDFWKGVSNGEITSNSFYTDLEVKSESPSIEVVNQAISDYLDEFKKELIQKNLDYNNSIYKPNIFGQDPMEGIKARISDKINRVVSKGLDDKTEDSMQDMFGYHVHRKVYQKLMGE